MNKQPFDFLTHKGKRPPMTQGELFDDVPAATHFIGSLKATERTNCGCRYWYVTDPCNQKQYGVSEVQDTYQDIGGKWWRVSHD